MYIAVGWGVRQWYVCAHTQSHRQMTYNTRFIEEQTIKRSFLCISILSDEDKEQSRKKKTANRQTSGEEKEGRFTNHTKGRGDKIKNVWQEEVRVQINTAEASIWFYLLNSDFPSPTPCLKRHFLKSCSRLWWTLVNCWHGPGTCSSCSRGVWQWS